ncbi:hypothetical protein OG709_30140 [Streptomyces sp. NBC_01267]|uniref:hypothetical protein n=1 Tax=Streptomyces sp. NBC_01267 TaxID=2903805 RepID=UPI002E35BA5B|nr:hypothetical protein [Streptomyces sp. NBC_01267]
MIVQEVIIPARDIRAGDVFTRHGKLRTATGTSGRGPYNSVCVPIDGGEVYFEREALVLVKREARRVPGVSAWVGP